MINIRSHFKKKKERKKERKMITGPNSSFFSTYFEESSMYLSRFCNIIFGANASVQISLSVT
jgi:hypothetical protein